MKRYVIDTNILYDLVFKENRCNYNNVLKLLNNNIGIVTYGTLLEVFNICKDNQADMSAVLKVMNKYNFYMAGNIEVVDGKFWKLVYCEEELSDSELKELKVHLVRQTSNYASKVLREIINGFAIIYTNMKLDKEENAFNLYVSWSDEVSNGFSHFPPLIEEELRILFLSSYTQETNTKFATLIQREFWGIIRAIEVRYNVLHGKSPEYIVENDFSKEIDREAKAFDEKYSEKDYLKFIQNTYTQTSRNKKMISANNIFGRVVYQNLTPLEKDFYVYCLQRLFIKQGKFKYNDIIDFMNLSTAYYKADGYMTLDKKFLKAVSQFACMTNSKFLNTSNILNSQIK